MFVGIIWIRWADISYLIESWCIRKSRNDLALSSAVANPTDVRELRFQVSKDTFANPSDVRK